MIYLFYFIIFIILLFSKNTIINGNINQYLFFVFFWLLFILLVWTHNKLELHHIFAITISKKVSQGAIIFAGLALLLLQFWRLNHPLFSSNNYVYSLNIFNALFNWQVEWETIIQGNGKLKQNANSIELSIDGAGASAIALRKMPELPSDQPWASMLRPIRTTTKTTEERTLTVVATATRTKQYLGLVFSNRFSIQLVNNGVLVTAPYSREDVRAEFIPFEPTFFLNSHEWTVAATGQKVQLKIDGIDVWIAPQYEALDQYVIGMPRLDQDHGGNITVQTVTVYRKKFFSPN